MPTSIHIIRQRKRRREQTRQSTEGYIRKMVFVSGFILSTLLVLGLLATAFAYADLTRDLPPVGFMPILLNTKNGLLLEPTRLYDRSGVHLLAAVAPADKRRNFLSYSQFPQALIDATIAIADADFWQHGGYILDGWRKAEIHPTLAQRLAVDLLLWDEAPTPRRGLRERLLAAQMTAEYGREQIMEWYLNSADYGHDAYGAEAAAQLYLDKSVTELDLGEAALLAALSQAPALNPLDAPEAAEELRKQVLQEMLLQGTITFTEADQAASNPPVIRPDQVGKTDDVTAFVNLVLDQLGQHFDSQRIRCGGLQIITTIDLELQLQSACAIKNELARLDGQDVIILAMDGSDCDAAELLPASLPADISPENASASAIIIDPHSGQVLAAVGDVSGGEPGAFLQPHPGGTLLTPFIYLTGFTRGLNPASLCWDIPGSLANLDGQYRGPVRLRVALVNDLLPPAGAVVEQMGMESIARIAAPFGLAIPAETNLLEDEISISPLDAAAIYGVFANQGMLAGQALSGESLRPVTVLTITGNDGEVWADWTAPQVQAVISPQLAYLMTDILSDHSTRYLMADYSTPQELDRPAAVKTGRALDLSGVWTAGYTPQRVVVVHVEADQSSIMLSGDLWYALMAHAVTELPPESWSIPVGLTTISVCDPSGLLPTDACPSVVTELFLAGNEPIQPDSLYQSLEVNRETGLLATVFTPVELIEKRIYMVVPPEASTWAEMVNLPMPPVEYDSIQTMDMLVDVNITTPRLFDEVDNIVEVRGNASGDDFSFYRLEYGQGLNPLAWVQIGSDTKTPVTGDVLGSWDTSGLDGLYALRLLVVRSDQRVEQAVVMVMVKGP